ncbi:carbohydrate binding family 9 domain-containing protein [Thalassotalea hakodatensis]|uniref:carbohydrate binding family 9 domain-containing protein n=1 Tax=Thalassotalea hakodatensis TaxID=3030492 RepID=UPI00257284ED|nr:carbohydrate binding family 9 domain-containing protein [Thalassotalea hakodatensis]
MTNEGIAQDNHELNIKRTINSPTIDGIISESFWQQITPIGDLHQIYPKPFEATTYRSEIKIAYDESNLYIMAKLFDDDIANLSQNVMSKGQDIEQDDHFGIVLDPFNDKTNGYYFATNANSFKEEGLIANNNQYLSNWDGIWFVETKTYEDFWAIEIAIPFSSLSFNPNSESWGINFLREIKQPEQTHYWTSHGSTPKAWAPEHAGIVNGIKNISQGAGVDIKLSSSFVQQHAREEKKNSQLEPSIDITYKPTSAITASITVNTDFSATEVDEQQINLTRFSLFTPEKRDFFLQGADIFEFGDISTNGRPFFSRMLGLSQRGEPLSINYGAKLTGQLDDTRFGVLAINQEADTIDNKNTSLAVARVSHQLNESFTLGLISTIGAPTIDKDSITAGIDWQYRNKSILNGDVVELKGWYQNSDNQHKNGRVKDSAYQVGLYLPNEYLNAKLAYTEIGEDFNPSLGFINRANIKQIDGWVSLTSPINFSWTNNSYHTVIFDQISSLNGGTISKNIFADLIDITTSNQQHFRLSHQYAYENITEPFMLLGKVEIPTNKYKYHLWEVATESDQSKPFSYNLILSKGKYLHGEMDYQLAGISTNINRFINLSLEADHRKIKFPNQTLKINSASAKVNIAFSPQLFWNNWFQYNNVSNEIGVYSRLVWQRTPLNSFNFVLNQSYIKYDNEMNRQNSHSSFSKQHQDTVIKLTYHWRY